MACVCCGNNQTTIAPDGVNKICPNCGQFYPVDTQVNMIYGTRFDHRLCGLDIAVTDRYFIVHEVPGQKTAKAAFGMVGWLVSVGKDNMEIWGYYDRNEFRSIIFPYRNKKLKDDWGMKFVRWDGSDFIIRGQFGTSLAKTAESLRTAGYPVVDGSDLFFGDTYCEKPFLTERALGHRICPSAASFARKNKDTFVAEPCPGAPQPSYQRAAARVAPQPAPQRVPQPAPQSIPLQAAPSDNRMSDRTDTLKKEKFIDAPGASVVAPVSTAAPAASADSFKFCHECGSKIRANDRFCPGCGTRQ